MITVKIDEDALLKILLDRVNHWTNDEDIIGLYRDYYKNLIYSGFFEGCELNIIVTVDNDYMNNLITISKEDFEGYNIEDETDNNIVALNKAADLYLIRTC